MFFPPGQVRATGRATYLIIFILVLTAISSTIATVAAVAAVLLHQAADLSILESFAVFGCAFLMRPIGGLVIGYIGDSRGRKYALEVSIFLMAVATTLMGCLPTYKQVGNPAILLLLIVRMMQGLSVGGQLMSSLVFTLEGHPKSRWGLYGSFVMAGANFGTLLGGLVAGGLRSTLNDEQMLAWGWRIPFLSGIIISLCGFYLKFFCADDEILPGHHGPGPLTKTTGTNSCDTKSRCAYNDEDTKEADEDVEYDQKFVSQDEEDDKVIIDERSYGTSSSSVISARHNQDSTKTPLEEGHEGHNIYQGFSSHQHQSHQQRRTQKTNPLRLAFSRQNFRSLLASSMVPMLWSGGFYLSFVWLAIWMKDFVKVESAFGINSLSLLLLGAWFPVAGMLSDMFSRKRVMTIGGVIFGGIGPIFLLAIANFGPSNKWIALLAQNGMGASLACWGAPMCAWLVEEFDPDARLTSVSIGYNVAQAIAGGLSPFIATLLVDEVGNAAPGILLFSLGIVSMTGLRIVAPAGHSIRHTAIANSEVEEDEADRKCIELRQIT